MRVAFCLFKTIHNLHYEQIGKEVRCIEDELPFEIPDSWVWCKLDSICSKLVDGDHNPPKSTSNQTNYLMCSSTNINDDKLTNLEKVRYLTKEVFNKENERTKCKEGDIFFTSVGSLGRSCIYKGNLNICFQRSVSVITTLVFNQYLKYYFDNPYFQNKVNKEATGTAQKGFYLNRLATSLIAIPPLNEQYRIVNKLKQLKPLIDKYKKAEEKLFELNSNIKEQLKKSILQYAIEGKLVPQDPNDEPASVLLERIRKEKEKLTAEGKIKKDKNESVIYRRDNSYYEKCGKKSLCIDEKIPFDIPKTWEWTNIESISLLIGNRNNQIPTNQILPIGSIPVVSQSKELIDGYCNNEDKKIDILPLVMFGDHTRNVKYIDFEFVVGADGTKFHKIILCNAKYIYYWMKHYARIIINRGYARHYSLLKECYIPLPPIQEQNRIVSKIETILLEINTL